MDAPNLDEFLACLNRQFSIFRQLLDLARLEREAIVGVKIKELRDFTYSKEALVSEIDREELLRINWVKEFAHFAQVRIEDVTMDVIAAKMAPERYEQMMSLKNALTVIVSRVSEHNADNRALIETALKDAQAMKRNILGLSSEAPQVYGPKGSMGGSTPDKSARFFNKEA